jgi:hypothetical protein
MCKSLTRYRMALIMRSKKTREKNRRSWSTVLMASNSSAGGDVRALMKLGGEFWTGLFKKCPSPPAKVHYDASVGWFALSGASVPDVNMGALLVPDGAACGERLKEWVPLLRKENVPVLIFVPRDVADAVAPVAVGLGLLGIGSVPCMAITRAAALASAPPKATNVSIKEASTAQQVRAHCALCFSGWTASTRCQRRREAT